jgi:hypothetical protein
LTEDKMLPTPPRRPIRRAGRALALAATTSVAVIAFSSTPALAASTSCEGQTFSQSFASFGDLNQYTLAPGSQFDSPEEGWELSAGAQIVQAQRPDGRSGGVLELPVGGARAESPPVCVTLAYPTARMWLRELNGAGNVKVSVVYAGRTQTGRSVAALYANGVWAPTLPFEVRPELGGFSEEAREVRFIFAASGGHGFQISGLYVDPRMR